MTKKTEKHHWEKKSDSYKTIRDETSIYEQKLVNNDEFNDVEKTEVRERVTKRKEKRREVAEKNKLLEKKKKTGTI